MPYLSTDYIIPMHHIQVEGADGLWLQGYRVQQDHCDALGRNQSIRVARLDEDTCKASLTFKSPSLRWLRCGVGAIEASIELKLQVGPHLLMTSEQAPLAVYVGVCRVSSCVGLMLGRRLALPACLARHSLQPLTFVCAMLCCWYQHPYAHLI
jgi:hypothetical protein